MARFLLALTIAVLAGTLAVLAGAGLMFTATLLLAKAALHPPLYTLMLLVTGVRFFGLSRGVFRYIERLFGHEATFRWLARLKIWVFDQLALRVPTADKGLATGEMMEHLLGDVARLEPLFARFLLPALTAVLVGLGAALGMRALDPALAGSWLAYYLVLGVALPLLAYLGFARYWPQRAAILTEMRQQALELFGGLAELRVYGGLDDRAGALGTLANQKAHLERRAALWQGVITGASDLVAGLGLLALFLVAAKLFAQGRLEGVWLPALVLGGFAAFEAVLSLPQSATELPGVLAARRRLAALTRLPIPAPEPARPQTPPGEGTPALEDAWVRYPGAPAPVLRGASLALDRPGGLWLTGRSGAGKSTVAWTWLRFVLPEKGQARLGTKDYRELTGENVRRQFVYLDQRPHLFWGTIRDNLLIAREDADDAELYAALARAELAERVRELPQGLDTLLGPGGVELSGGERRRLALARAFLKDAPYWILDEPTEGLDAATEARVLASIRAHLGERPALWISHRPLLGLDLPRAVLEEGRIRLEDDKAP